MIELEIIVFGFSLLIGVVAGLLAGLLGVGGGLIIVPCLLGLLPLLGVETPYLTHLSIGTSLMTIVLTSISSVKTHYQLKGIELILVKRLLPGLVFGAWLGAFIAGALSSNLLMKVFGAIMILLSLKMFLSQAFPTQKKSWSHYKMNGAGTVIGCVSSIAGIGGGSLSVPFFLHLGYPMVKAIGTAAACGLPLAISGAISFMSIGWSQQNLPSLSLGYLYLPAFFGIVLTSVVTAPVGARLAHRLPTQQLKKFFALFLVLVGLKIIFSS
ncbi:MAG: sulfite exporter TauE/SafE family protein [Pseudomonadota bacterium]